VPTPSEPERRMDGGRDDDLDPAEEVEIIEDVDEDAGVENPDPDRLPR
jgi:hypothetical protein